MKEPLPMEKARCGWRFLRICEDCGKESTVTAATIKNVARCCISCGKKRAARPRIGLDNRGGGAGCPIYRRWTVIHRRVAGTSPKNKRNYTDKGITVCKEWHIFLNFKRWALESGFDKSLTIDRIDNSKGYEPGNCRWVSLTEQALNTSRNLPTRERIAEIFAMREAGMLHAQIAEKIGRSVSAVQGVLSGRSWKGLRGAVSGASPAP